MLHDIKTTDLIIVGGLSTGSLEVERTERELKPDFQTSFGLRKIGRFQYEPKRGVKSIW